MRCVAHLQQTVNNTRHILKHGLVSLVWCHWSGFFVWYLWSSPLVWSGSFAILLSVLVIIKTNVTYNESKIDKIRPRVQTIPNGLDPGYQTNDTRPCFRTCQNTMQVFSDGFKQNTHGYLKSH